MTIPYELKDMSVDILNPTFQVYIFTLKGACVHAQRCRLFKAKDATEALLHNLQVYVFTTEEVNIVL